MPVKKSEFDKDSGITLYTLVNSTNRLKVKIIDYGATLVNVIVPDRNNVERDVVLGFDDLDGYQSKFLRNPYFGASIGRVANRIGNASFELGGQSYKLCANSGSLSLHSGPNGFDKRKWSLVAESDYSITLQYTSPDNEQGYPGSLDVRIQFTVTSEDELRIEYSAALKDATASKQTIVNLTNHSYFNLNGAYNEEASKILDHMVLLQADNYLDIDANLVPTGKITLVKDTLLDFTDKAHAVGERTHQVLPAGYDHCFVLDSTVEKFRIDPGPEVRKAAEVWAPLTGIKMTMSTTEPAVQFYTGSKIANGHKQKATQCESGKKPASILGPYSGLCLEAQRFPDAINNDQWRKQVILSGGEPKYRQITVYKFQVSDGI